MRILRPVVDIAMLAVAPALLSIFAPVVLLSCSYSGAIMRSTYAGHPSGGVALMLVIAVFALLVEGMNLGAKAHSEAVAIFSPVMGEKIARYVVYTLQVIAACGVAAVPFHSM